MTKRKMRARRKPVDGFANDPIAGEYEKPGPRIDPDAAKIGAMICEITKKAQPRPVVLNWMPPWLVGSLQKTASNAAKSLRKAEGEIREAAKKQAEAKTQDERDDAARAMAQANMRIASSTDALKICQIAQRSYQDTPAFGFFFFEEKLALDLIERDGKEDERDALEPSLSPAAQQVVSIKTALCHENGIRYLAIGPDDDLDKLQLAAKLNMTICRKGDRKAAGRPVFTEEEIES